MSALLLLYNQIKQTNIEGGNKMERTRYFETWKERREFFDYCDKMGYVVLDYGIKNRKYWVKYKTN